MNNAIYGKTTENVRNRIHVRLLNSEKDYLKWPSKPSYMWDKIFDNNLVAKRKNKVTLMINKPTYIGMCILELSKVFMCKFHYCYIKNKYGNNLKLLFTDTDSLMYEIKLKITMKILAVIKKCLILVITRLCQDTNMIQTNYSLEK